MIPRPVKWTVIKDRPALRAQFLQWAALPTLKRILVSHGEPIEHEPAEALRDFAQSLAKDRPVPRPRRKPADTPVPRQREDFRVL